MQCPFLAAQGADLVGGCIDDGGFGTDEGSLALVHHVHQAGHHNKVAWKHKVNAMKLHNLLGASSTPIRQAWHADRPHAEQFQMRRCVQTVPAERRASDTDSLTQEALTARHAGSCSWTVSIPSGGSGLCNSRKCSPCRRRLCMEEGHRLMHQLPSSCISCPFVLTASYCCITQRCIAMASCLLGSILTGSKVGRRSANGTCALCTEATGQVGSGPKWG